MKKKEITRAKRDTTTQIKFWQKQLDEHLKELKHYEKLGAGYSHYVREIKTKIQTAKLEIYEWQVQRRSYDRMTPKKKSAKKPKPYNKMDFWI